MTGWGYYVQNVIWRLLESPRDVTGIPQVLMGGENIAEEISCLHLLGRFVLEDHSISSHIQTFLSPFKMSINTMSYCLDRRENSRGKIKYIFFFLSIRGCLWRLHHILITEECCCHDGCSIKAAARLNERWMRFRGSQSVTRKKAVFQTQ